VTIQFAGSEMTCHMSVFQPRTYKPAHRHGPGRAIVIPGGEGFSLMWEEGKERVIVPWHEGAMFVPPNKWFHQHFNLAGDPARYLALHPMMQFHGHDGKVVDRAKTRSSSPTRTPGSANTSSRSWPSAASPRSCPTRLTRTRTTSSRRPERGAGS